MKQFLIALDQLFNTLLGGMADETLSARAYRTNSPLKTVIDTIFFWDKDHCLTSYLAEFDRKQLPSDYRS